MEFVGIMIINLRKGSGAMGLFRKNEDEQEKRPVNPTNMVLIRLLAVGYLMYCLYQMANAYFTGSEDAPQLWLLLLATVVFVAGAVWVVIVTYRQFKRLKEEQQAQWEEEDRLVEEADQLEEAEEDFEEVSAEDFEEETE